MPVIGSKDHPPRTSEKELERLSGIAELLVPFSLSDIQQLAAGAEGALVRTNLGKGREGIVTDWACEWPGDWKTSPVFVATLEIGTQDATTGLNNGKVERKWLGPYKSPVASMAQPKSLLPYGLFFRVNQDVGVVLKNGEAVATNGKAFIQGWTWNERHARKVREVLLAQGFLGPPWASGSVFGGP